jgi:hypothetical protein
VVAGPERPTGGSRDEGERAQALTLEAVVAALLLLSSVVFALQVTAVTPLSASTSSQQIESQLGASAEGVLAASVADGSLRRAILSYNESAAAFVGADGESGEYRSDPPENVFGQRLGWAFDDRGIAYNVYLTYRSGEGSGQRRFIYRGQPSDNAVVATTNLVLTDGTALYNDSDGDGRAEARPTTLADLPDGRFYARNQSGTEFYNVVRVEVVAWRI